MMNYILIQDDSSIKSEIIADVIGERGFLDVVVKRKKLGDYYSDFIKEICGDLDIVRIKSYYELEDLENKLEKRYSKSTKIIHSFSDFIISDNAAAALTFEKIKYVDSPYRIMSSDKCVAVLFESIDSYKEFVDDCVQHKSSKSAAKLIENETQIQGVLNIGEISNFIQCISGQFDARYFNALKGNEYTLTKTSDNKEKIKAEYQFYHFLPEDMKYWFVEPFNYTEEGSKASYTMERLHMTDIAIKWVHGSISTEELEQILNKYFYFFSCRHKKEVDETEYKNIANELYVNKVLKRVDDLKKLKEFEKIESLLKISFGYGIDSIVKRYLDLKEKIEKDIKTECISVIGHGDPCFANTMYNKSTKTLKFIDPKGALSEEELWTNPYYDIAKLSHSICGRYDFFNNDLFEITVDKDMSSKLTIDFDNSEYVKVFKAKVEENGFNYMLVRLYEASLFISMLPLHIDNPHKVYGFILNAVNILDEIENNL